MRVEKFNAEKNQRISELIQNKYSEISYNNIMKLFRNKDIKINGKRISKDIDAIIGDEIVFYINEDIFEKKIDIIFEDNNIVIVFKPRKIEVSNVSNSLEEILSKQLNCKCYPVHRLDMNTTGLVIFAKNEQSKSLLENVFKNRTIEKYYLALICGSPQKTSDNMIAYLKKDKNNSVVFINDYYQNGYDKIETKYNVIKKFDTFSLVDIELVTGKTHQIRAHFAHIGNPIVGDEKYGNSSFNKKIGLKYQCLCSYKIIFHFDKNSYLSYLDKKVFKLDNQKIDFLKLCK